jgi:lysophospholipase L1-like esterase
VVIRLSGSGEIWSLVVNGVDNYILNTVPNDGADHFITVTFATSATRTITLNNAFPIQGVFTTITNGFLTGKGTPKPRMVLLGDSFIEQGYAPGAQCEGLASQLKLLLPQLDIWALGEGGTGFVNPGISGGTNFNGRITDVVNANPKFVAIYGGINDTGYATDTSPTNIVFVDATNLIRTLQSQVPLAQIAVIGPQWPRTPFPEGDSNVYNCALLLSNACAVTGVPYTNPLHEPWITGNTLIPNSGNADLYTSASDGTHPTIPAGAGFYANKIVSALSQFWNFSTTFPNTPFSSLSLVTNCVPTPVSGLGILWNSNNALYWVTTSHTNYITGP